MKDLLIISCSEKKHSNLTREKMPAIDAYTGVFFQVIKKARREGYWPPNLRLGIISAKYGLLKENDPISYYNQKMTITRARELKTQIQTKLKNWVNIEHFNSIYVLIGKIYLLTLHEITTHIDTPIYLLKMGKGIGEGQRNLKYFLQQFSNKEKIMPLLTPLKEIKT